MPARSRRTPPSAASARPGTRKAKSASGAGPSQDETASGIPASGQPDAGKPQDVGPQQEASTDDRPVRITPDHHLNTGLADYGMWVRMFSGAAQLEAEPGSRHRGRIWA